MPDPVHAIEVSIIIPAFNCAGQIHRCLEALNRQDVARDRFETIVVDDGSSDGTATAARPLCDRVIETPNRGPAAARNSGAAVAHGA
ncbi:glycosyltransferase family 2 protein, partial [bacterium]|nr:glycosyltransferase family 2 protein [candidate division CSSED10-310 bacterium]